MRNEPPMVLGRRVTNATPEQQLADMGLKSSRKLPPGQLIASPGSLDSLLKSVYSDPMIAEMMGTLGADMQRDMQDAITSGEAVRKARQMGSRETAERMEAEYRERQRRSTAELELRKQTINVAPGSVSRMTPEQRVAYLRAMEENERAERGLRSIYNGPTSVRGLSDDDTIYYGVSGAAQPTPASRRATPKPAPKPVTPAPTGGKRKYDFGA